MADEPHPLELGQDAQFSIQKVYVKDLSFETPHSPEIFKAEWQPGMDMHLTNEGRALGDALYEVVLSITLTVKLDQQTAYLVEVNQAGIFLIDQIPEPVIERMLATVCPNILFPFARETVSDVVSRGGFPQLLLAPVNFEALYLQQQQQQAGGAAGPDVAH